MRSCRFHRLSGPEWPDKRMTVNAAIQESFMAVKWKSVFSEYLNLIGLFNVNSIIRVAGIRLYGKTEIRQRGKQTVWTGCNSAWWKPAMSDIWSSLNAPLRNVI